MTEAATGSAVAKRPAHVKGVEGWKGARNQRYEQAENPEALVIVCYTEVMKFFEKARIPHQVRRKALELAEAEVEEALVGEQPSWAEVNTDAQD